LLKEKEKNTGGKEMVLEIFPGVSVNIGAHLTIDEIRKLPENLKAVAEKEYEEAQIAAREKATKDFYLLISELFAARKFSEVICKIANTQETVSAELTELAKVVLLLRLREPVSNSADMANIAALIRKIGGKLTDDPWKEKLNIDIKSTENIEWLARALKEEGLSGKLVSAMEFWERRNGVSVETLKAREILGAAIDSVMFLKGADHRLSHGGEQGAIKVYIALKERKYDIEWDGRQRKLLIEAYDSGKEGYPDRVLKAARKIGLVAKDKK